MTDKIVKVDKTTSGTPTKDNLAGWGAYAKGNSYQPDKAELQHKVGTQGAAADLKINEAEAPHNKPYFEGKGWVGSKRD